MGKSLKRVQAAIDTLGIKTEIIETGKATTAAEAAAELGCTPAQIVKSIIFAGEVSDVVLFLTSGDRRVDLDLAQELAGENLTRADAALIRRVTGFAIGGVSPIGHLTPCPVYFDPNLLSHPVIYGAAGTPHHVFGIAPPLLLQVTQAVSGPFTAIM